jgi:uncharacterized protein YbjT (DUF2867 family)
MARIVMIGATGLIGRSLAPLLIGKGHDLLLVGRRESGIAGAREKIGEMHDWPGMLEGEAADVAISTLGTTRKQAGTWAKFVAVDEQAVLAFAAAARRAGARQMLGVSSVGADPESRNDYLALKGRVERSLAKTGFDRLDIFRPGLLIGNRGNDRRTGERIGIALSPIVNPFLRGRFDRFAAIPATRVAAAMAALTGQVGNGTFIHQNRQIRALS